MCKIYMSSRQPKQSVILLTPGQSLGAGLRRLGVSVAPIFRAGPRPAKGRITHYIVTCRFCGARKEGVILARLAKGETAPFICRVCLTDNLTVCGSRRVGGVAN